MMKTATVLMLFLFLAFAAHADEAIERTPSAQGASVGFFNLQDGSIVPPVFAVQFSITGMGVAPAGVEIENTGHHHLLIDVETLPDLDRPLPATDKIIHFGKGESKTELSLPEGPHTLQLILADYRHIPHDPPVMSEPINIVVKAGAPEPVKPES